MRAHRRFTTLLVLLIFIVSLAAFCSGDGGEDEYLHDVTMEAPDELFEYEADLVDERLEEEENEMDEQFLKNHQNQEQRMPNEAKDPEEILDQVDDIYAEFEEKKGWLFANYTLRVSTEKAVEALLQEGQRALDFAEQNDALFHVQNSPHFAKSTDLPNEQSSPLEFARLWTASEALFVLAAALETGTLPLSVLSQSQRDMFAKKNEEHIPWTLKALRAAHFAGNDGASVALADRVLVGRGGVAENCQMAVQLLHPLAAKRELEIHKAGAGSVSGMPAQATWLRDRERDASWHSDVMEESLAEEHQKNFVGGADDSHEFTPHGNSGTPESTRVEGYRRLMGTDGRERDEIGALQRFENAARRGDRLAALNAGFMHMRGNSENVPVNVTAAEKYFKQAGDVNGGGAFNGIGVIYYNKKDFVTARHWFEKGMATNNPDCYYNMGTLHLLGLGNLERNATQGFLLYEKASKSGHWKAPFDLARMHMNGQGTPVNCTRAARLFRIFYDERTGWADDLDNAMDILDGVDENRKKVKGVPPDPFGALILYSLYAEQGSEVAIQNIAWMLRKNLTGVDIPNRFEIAGSLLRRVTRAPGLAPEANVDLGNMLWNKQIKAKPEDFALCDDEERSMVSQGDDSIEVALDYTKSTENNDGSSMNYNAAVHRYRRATEGDLQLPEAYHALAWAHFTGKGESKNSTAVLLNLDKAMELSRYDAEMFPSVLFYAYVRIASSFDGFVWMKQLFSRSISFILNIDRDAIERYYKENSALVHGFVTIFALVVPRFLFFRYAAGNR
jgi:TPR repeat protein